MASDVVVVLFNRDLRVHDHPALREAAKGATGVVPVFVLDPALLGSHLPSANRVALLLEALQDLRSSLQRKGAGLPGSAR
jgi:deoxyribodipyrimidine photo-lyase